VYEDATGNPSSSGRVGATEETLPTPGGNSMNQALDNDDQGDGEDLEKVKDTSKEPLVSSYKNDDEKMQDVAQG
jgi:hypothetical protein